MITCKNRDGNKFSPSLDYEALMSMPLPLFDFLDVAVSSTAPAARSMNLAVEQDLCFVSMHQHAKSVSNKSRVHSMKLLPCRPLHKPLLWKPTSPKPVLSKPIVSINERSPEHYSSIFRDDETRAPFANALSRASLHSLLSSNRKRQAELRIAAGVHPKRTKGINHPPPSVGSPKAGIDAVAALKEYWACRKTLLKKGLSTESPSLPKETVERDIFKAEEMALVYPDDATSHTSLEEMAHGTPSDVVLSDTSLTSEAEQMALSAQPDMVPSDASLISKAEEMTLGAQPVVATSDTSLPPSKCHCVPLQEQRGMYLTSVEL
jgi:hypothetical protein